MTVFAQNAKEPDYWSLPCMWRLEYNVLDISMARVMLVGANEIIKVEGIADIDRCHDWLRTVFSNTQSWETRFGYIHTYGNAWYLDIEAGLLHYYHANSSRTNALLKELPELVPTLLRASEYMVGPSGETGLPCRFRALNLGPYWADAGVVMMVKGVEGEVHADYEGLAPYPAQLFDSGTRAYSAVLTLAVAASGGDLRIWKRRHLANEEPNLTDDVVETVKYSVGSMVIFDSFCYHQISQSKLNDQHPWRAVAAVHFLFKSEPFPHWEHWF